MRRVATLTLCLCAALCLGLLSGAAKAGDYYEGGSRNRDSGNVWYSSTCCYKKVVRHVRSVRYVRVHERRSYYNERPYRQSYYTDSPRRYSGDIYAPRRHVRDEYAPRRYVDSNRYGNGYSSYAQSCVWHRDRIDDGEGGWVWGNRRQVCH